jgi:predicted adenine nucleotide alpha hydrolase (AANH) superfamily ATPase
MTTTTDRKPLTLHGGHSKVPWYSCENFHQQEYCGCVYSLRDTNRHRMESGRERIQHGVKFYGDDDSRGEA